MPRLVVIGQQIKEEQCIYSTYMVPKYPSLNRVKRDIPIKRLGNGIFVKANTKRFTEFTNCNLSQRLVELTLLFFQ